MKNVTVRRWDDESVDSLIKRFSKAVEKDETMKYFKRSMEYESPAIKKKRKHQNALKRMARERRKEERARQNLPI